MMNSGRHVSEGYEVFAPCMTYYPRQTISSGTLNRRGHGWSTSLTDFYRTSVGIMTACTPSAAMVWFGVFMPVETSGEEARSYDFGEIAEQDWLST